MTRRSIQLSLEMLLAVVNGDTYEEIGDRCEMTRSAVESRIKRIALKLMRDVGIEGLTEDSVHSAQRLRSHREAVIAALNQFEPRFYERMTASILSDDDIRVAVSRVHLRSRSPARDVALLYVLLCTAARPLEIARLIVSDYLEMDGRVRHESVLRASIAVNHLERPLFFMSTKAVDAIDDYLRERVKLGHCISVNPLYRGLQPDSSLFLKSMGAAFKIDEQREGEAGRVHCREILENYRKIFRYIGKPGLSAISLRRTLATRLYHRGASEEQVGDILGITDPKGIRERFPRPLKSLPQLIVDLI